MLDLENTFIADSVVHARNLAPENIRLPREAEPLAEMIIQGSKKVRQGPILTDDSLRRDWKIEDTAKLVFAEGYADTATYHPTPIAAFEDGFNSLDKAKEAQERWPNRFNIMASIDPLNGESALESLEDQVEKLDPIGLKVYPYGWPGDREKSEIWRMDDYDVAFPFIEKAKELGLDFIAVHKAVPLGRSPVSGANPDDMDVAAKAFPDMNFCIVHGGLAFLETTALQLAMFDNIYVDLEGAGFLVVNKERRLAEILGGLCEYGGENVFNKIFWSTGIPPRVHPQIQYNALKQFKLPSDIENKHDITFNDRHKEKLIGENYANVIGIEQNTKRKQVKNDVFSKMRSNDESLPDPYSTIEEVKVDHFQ